MIFSENVTAMYLVRFGCGKLDRWDAGDGENGMKRVKNRSLNDVYTRPYLLWEEGYGGGSINKKVKCHRNTDRLMCQSEGIMPPFSTARQLEISLRLRAHIHESICGLCLHEMSTYAAAIEYWHK